MSIASIFKLKNPADSLQFLGKVWNFDLSQIRLTFVYVIWTKARKEISLRSWQFFGALVSVLQANKD